VRHEQRQRVLVLRANVRELDVDAVDLGHELGQGITFASPLRQS